MAGVLKPAAKQWSTQADAWGAATPAKGAGKPATPGKAAGTGKGAGKAAAPAGAAAAGEKGWGKADMMAMMMSMLGKGGWGGESTSKGGKAGSWGEKSEEDWSSWSLPPWAQGATTAASKAGGKDSKGKGAGKSSKGKGAGKTNPGVPAADDPFWTQKLSAENRQEGDGSTYSGKVTAYIAKAGWGFIQPDTPEALPAEVQQALAASKAEAESRGKKITQDNLIYFRKPDLLSDSCQKDQMCTFQLYFDDKGVGAHSITVI